MTRQSLHVLSLFTLCSACTPAEGDSVLGSDTSVAAEDCALDTEAVGWSAESHAKGSEGDSDLVFPEDGVIRLDISICAGNWESLQADLDAVMEEAGVGVGDSGAAPPNGPPAGGAPVALLSDPAYVPVNVSFDGKTWPSVGFRYKGNSSLWGPYMEGRSKLPFRLEFDQYEDEDEALEDQRFWGYKELKFSSAYTDDSLIRDRLASTTFRDAGVPAAQGGFAAVYVDAGDGPVFWGLYTAYEDPCGELLDGWFGEDGGNCYEAEDEDLVTLNTEGLEKKTNEDEDDWSDVSALIDTLADRDLSEEDWRATLEAEFNVDGFLRALAVNNLIGNWDSYGLMSHNYFLYADPGDDGRLSWIPWDFNMSYTSESMRAPLSIGMDEVGEEWPMIRRLMDDEVYAAAYADHLDELLSGAFDAERQQERMERWHALVAEYAALEAEPYTNLSSAQGFEQALDEASDALTVRLDDATAEAEEWLDAR